MDEDSDLRERNRQSVERARAAIERVAVIEEDLARRRAYDQAHGISYRDYDDESPPRRNMVYKQHHDERREELPPARTPTGTMSAEQQEPWDKWLHTTISNRLNEFASGTMMTSILDVVDVIGEETAKRQNELRAEMRAELARRDGELETLRQIVRGDVKPMRGQSDAA